MGDSEFLKWMQKHQDDLSQFTDLEVATLPDDKFHALLEQSWFRASDWNEPGYRFTLFGQDGTGGEFALWEGSQGLSTTPVVFFGSEGGAGVLAPSPDAFVRALAHGAIVEEYPGSSVDAPSKLFDDNWMLESDEPGSADAARALIQYRSAVLEHFGHLDDLEQLVAVPKQVQDEFYGWVTSVQERVEERDREEQLLAEEKKHQDRLAKALRYASAIESELPSDVATLADGARFESTCPSCAEPGPLRLIRFDELAFGLCTSCYFSKAW